MPRCSTRKKPRPINASWPPRIGRGYPAAQALLRRTLTAVVPNHPPQSRWFERTALGKPYLSAPAVDGPPLHFSLSHTRGHVACAISRVGEVGVAVECRSHINDLETLMAGVCSADEHAQICAQPPPDQAVRLWSLKEACVKACGTGIDTKLAHITFDLRASSLMRASLPLAAMSWWLALFHPAVDSRIAVALAPDWGREVRLDVARVGADGLAVPMPPIRVSGLFEVVASIFG
jgi:4'-phosphopantetheinyl transferase